MSRFILVCVVLIGALALTGSYAKPMASSDLLDEIVAAIQNARSAVTEMEVKYTMVAVQASAGAPTWDAQHVRLLNQKMLIDQSWGDAENAASYEFGFDGVSRWQHRVGTSSVSVGSTPESAALISLSTEGGGFSDLMLWYPCHEARYGTLHQRDLVSMLTSGNAVVQAEKEWVGDSECVVVKFSGRYGRDFTVWLDPSRGFLPVLQRSHAIEPFSVELRIDATIEAAPGVWIATSGRRKVAANSAVDELKLATEHLIEVEYHSVNAGDLDPAEFDFDNLLVPGTTVVDLDTGESWLVSARNFSEAADVVMARASAAKNDAEVVVAGLSVSAPWRNAYWLGLMIGCALTSGWLLLKGRQ